MSTQPPTTAPPPTTMSLNALVTPRPKVSELSPEQTAAIPKLRAMVSKYDYPEKDGVTGVFRLDDETLLRFLFARDFNVHRASQMLASHMKMRSKFRPHELRFTDEGLSLTYSSDPEKAYWLHCGVVEIEGVKSTLEVVRVANYDPSKFANAEQYLRNILYLKEMSTRLQYTQGVNSFIVVFDIAGWSLLRHGTPAATMQIRHLIEIVQNGYPETLRAALILNTPTLFKWTWTIVSAFVEERTKAKIVWLEKPEDLLRWIPANLLPPSVGGSRLNFPTIEEIDQAGR